ncbi:MAG: hypothetical protein Kow0077_23540 [Anaerolineae bacterium]
MRKGAILLVIAFSLIGWGCNLFNGANPPPTVQPVLPTSGFTLAPPPTITPLPTSTPVLLPPTAIPTAAPLYTATPAPTRISFARGTTETTLFSQTIVAGGSQTYAINALSGQTLIATLTPVTPTTALTLAVSGADGTLLGRSAPGALQWTGKLPASGDYRITVQNAGPATSYALTVTIPRNVTFTAGETTTAINGSVSGSNVLSYLLEGSAGQPAIVNVITPGGNAWLAVTGLDGTVLLSPEARAVRWAGNLPGTQGYLLQVGAGTGTADFTLQVTVPQRVRFPTGATSTRLRGELSGQYDGVYVLGAAEGQLMRVTLSAPETGNNAWLTIEGADGNVLLPLTEMRTFWSGRLPASQDYYVRVVTDGSPATYSLYIEIARRIQFAPGTTATRLEGTIVQPEGVTYVLEARAGQVLSARVNPAADVYLTIVGEDGIPLARYQGDWSGTLPATQDYTITVAAAGGATGIAYTLEVSVTG